MIRVIHKIFTLLVLSIGAIHTVGTFFFFSSLNEAAIWFAGAGLCAIFAAMINIALWPPDSSVLSRRLGAGANLLFFFWLAAGVSATPALPQFIVAGIGSAMFISAAVLGRHVRGRS